MKKETALRIQEYNSRLPRLKERVIMTVALMLIGVVMLTTVSFAWLTISVNPEVSNISTSIASNGNLEIALATGTLSSLMAPGATQVGDGNLPVTEGNITWGNLINLSDPQYGLSNIVLRPAGLNRDNLLKSPLYGAAYDETGKHNSYINSFRFGKWQSTNVDDPNAPWEFGISNELGVRAILSTHMAESAGYAYEYQIKLNDVSAAISAAQNAYLNITKNIDIADGNKEKPFLESLAAVMGAYMTARMNPDEPSLQNKTMSREHMEAFRDLFYAFGEVLKLEQEAMRKLANLQIFVLYGGDAAYKDKEFATVEALIAKKNDLTVPVTDANGVTTNVRLKLSGLAENVTDATKLQEGYQSLVEKCNTGGDIKWDADLSAIVNKFVTVGTCTVDGTLVNNIGATAALSLNNKECNTVITNGILYNFEKRTGASMEVKRLKVVATGKRLGITMDGTIYANITTNAPTPSMIQKDLNYTDENNTGGAAQLTANDTYGFAIDFWVRTNASGSFLILEGNVLTETIEVDVKGTDGDGNEVQLFVNTIKVTDESTGEEVTYTEDVYEKNGKWYYDGTNTECTNIDSKNPPKKKVNVIENVIGYEGENRVWDNNAFLSIDSTTQGSGSCYVYYYNTPEDMERSLKLLGSLKIAFVDAEGNLLAEGYMDTEHYFDDNGKVTVPMALNADSIKLTNPDGSETLAITPLDKNVAKLITAIVYLDGTKVENKDVLAVSEIQGQMNIQFGSSVDLNSIDDEKLSSESMSVSASTSQTKFNFDESVAQGRPMTTTLTVNVSGSTPQRVSAFFVRQISSTQGIPMNGANELINFVDAGGGKWTANYTFSSPGTYIMRSIWVDGIEYDLEPNARPTIEVEGFTVKTLTWESTSSNVKDFMTAANSVSDNLILEFMANDVANMPTKVEGRFLRTDGNSVNVTFTRNAGNNKWYGKATFLSSGEYTLEYLVFDGEYYPVDSSMQRVAKVYLGMKAAVYTSSPLSFVLGYGVDGDPSNGMTPYEENLYMQIKIMDDTGVEMRNLNNVKLYYSLGGYNTEVNGLDADMEWNASTGYYEGRFNTKAGVFQFLYVTVGDNVIRTATTSPKFIIQSPTPPSFNTGNTTSWQYRPDYTNNPAKLSVILNDTDGIDASSMIGIISDGSIEYRVTGNPLADGEWTFDVPLKQGSQDGTWTLTRIEIVGLYHNGDVSTEENPFVIDLAGKSDLTATVLSTINITTDKNNNINFSGEFLQVNTLTNALLGGITIADKNNKELPGMYDTIELVYTYGKDSLAKGGYTINFAVPDLKITLKKDATGTYFVQDEAALATVKYAGTYTLSSLSFTFDGGSITLTGHDLPKLGTITVTSTAPSVKITGISTHTGIGTSSKTDYTATVYFGKSNVVDECGSVLGENYSHPYVTIALSGIGKASKATLTFTTTSNNGKVYLCTSNLSNNTSDTDSYTWTKDGDCQRYVGLWKSQSAGDSKTAAGELKATELVLTDPNDSSKTYTVDITDITINNPS